MDAEKKRDREHGAEAEGPLHPRARCTQEEVDGPLHPLVAAWEAARHERDWARADAIRDELRAQGVNPGARQRADHGRYDAAWAQRTRELRCISTAGFLASSLGWELSPRLQTLSLSLSLTLTLPLPPTLPLTRLGAQPKAADLPRHRQRRDPRDVDQHPRRAGAAGYIRLQPRAHTVAA